jgi:putative transposase
MKDDQRLQHTLWECKYHLVFIPQYRRKAWFMALRKDRGPGSRDLARRKGGRGELSRVEF